MVRDMGLIRKSVKVTFIFIVTFLLFPCSIYAYGGADYAGKELTSGNWVQISDGMKVQYSSNDSGGLDVKLSSKGLQKGYYTVSLANKLNDDLTGYGMVCFKLKSNSANKLRFNFFIDKTDGSRVAVGNDKAVIIKSSNSQLMEKVYPTYGAITVAKNFEGTVYIPFSSLENQVYDKKSSNNNNQYKNYPRPSYGILVTSAENEEESFTADSFKLIDSKAEIISDNSKDFRITGADRVQLPVAGESVSQYKTNINGGQGDVNYKLDSAVKGVSVSKGGLLTIKEGVKPQTIKIEALLNNYLETGIEVELYKSWAVGVKDAEGNKISIPKAGDIQPITDKVYKYILSDNILICIRIVFGIAALIYIGMFIYWRKKEEV